jgi:hypothetical protein
MISEHPQAEKMKGSLTTGQLWTLDADPRLASIQVKRGSP